MLLDFLEVLKYTVSVDIEVMLFFLSKYFLHGLCVKMGIMVHYSKASTLQQPLQRLKCSHLP